MSESSAIGYVRVSTREQAREGISVEAQHAMIEKYCALKGLTLARTVEDVAVSAARNLRLRPGGTVLLRAIRGGEAGVVVATRLDRLFRDCTDCLSVTKRWDKAGVALHLVDLGGQPVDTTSAMGRFFLTVMGGAAEMERNLLSERVREVYQHKRDKGERWGQIPYGQSLAPDGVMLEPQESELEVLEVILKLRQVGGLSIRAIARHLNENYLPACRGQRWHKTTVARLINRLEAEDSG